jgi:hypothetical protein
LQSTAARKELQNGDSNLWAAFDFQIPKVLTGNVLVERRTYSRKWSVSFVKIIVIANGTIREIGTDGEIGIGMGTKEMVVAATTEDGDFWRGAGSTAVRGRDGALVKGKIH